MPNLGFMNLFAKHKLQVVKCFTSAFILQMRITARGTYCNFLFLKSKSLRPKLGNIKSRNRRRHLLLKRKS